VDRRWDVRRGDFGCLVSCSSWLVSPLVSFLGTAGTGGGPGDISCGWLLAEEDRRLVKDRVLSTDAVRATSITASSFASSNVSYETICH
jgi:hypothetical protein